MELQFTKKNYMAMSDKVFFKVAYIPIPEKEGHHNIKIDIGYPRYEGPYTVEDMKQGYMRSVRDSYKLSPDEWFIHLLGSCMTPQHHTWHRYAAKELIEENYEMIDHRNPDCPLYPVWIGGDYWKDVERGNSRLCFNLRLTQIIGDMLDDLLPWWKELWKK
jgi:hypothetical protein